MLICRMGLVLIVRYLSAAVTAILHAQGRLLFSVSFRGNVVALQCCTIGQRLA